ncbi:3'-5' exonuclease [Nocardiopsis exhalans]|uniref:3'-5' exonuclease n=1 Tax=Nocardiopsis exhalans TaxID=163604 RepID=A0ABY5DBM8_9ACTN|nr:3'-5' exonuclease [Nocardiopsis exhalans]USY21737.1 3'-5' exonuclease [Nocardiopsis exhalans]
MLDQPWTGAPLCALDLEGTGAQDREREAILEVATVPIIGGSPDMAVAYESLVNPGRPVPQRRWISPGLTDDVLRQAPDPKLVGTELDKRVSGRYLVGHNVAVDWRLIHLHYPDLRPVGLIDTLRLARATRLDGSKSLGALLGRFDLRSRVDELVPSGRPHRALWDAVAAALLLAALIDSGEPPVRSLRELIGVAAIPLDPDPHPDSDELTLF